MTHEFFKPFCNRFDNFKTVSMGRLYHLVALHFRQLQDVLEFFFPFMDHTLVIDAKLNNHFTNIYDNSKIIRIAMIIAPFGTPI